MPIKIRNLPSPILLFFLILISIFFADIATTVFLSKIQRPRLGEVELVDSFLLALISFPMVFFFMYRPLAQQITKRRMAEEKAINLYAAIEQTDEAVIISTVEGKIQYANPAFERITGYLSNEAANKEIWVLKNGQSGEDTVKEMRQAMHDGASWKGDLVLKKMDGQFFDAFVSIAPVKHDDGSLFGYISVIGDITQRKQSEIALRAAKEQADSAVKLKEKFVTLVVHDLKTPFNSIIGYLQILKRDIENPIHEKHKDLIERMLLTSGTMVKMIDELLSLSRLQQGSIKPKKRYFNAHSMVENVTKEFHFLLEKKGIALKNLIPPNAEIFADYHLMKEVVQNLVSNAVKFTNKGGIIIVSFPLGIHNIISVKDSGVGINRQIISDLFRMEERTSTYGTLGERGSGFGLPLSHEIVKSHGGDLTVESEEEKGSTFFIKLPDIKPLMLIFGADDEAREVLKNMLASLNVKIMETNEIEEAKNIVKHNSPNLVIIDRASLTSENLSLLAHIKDNLNSKNIPVIAITTLTENKEVKNMLFESHVDDYVTKPFTENELLPRIKRFLYYI